MLSKRASVAHERFLLSVVWVFSISCLWLILTFYQAREDIDPADVLPVTGFCALVLAIQIAFLFLMKRWAWLLLPALTLANTFFLYGAFSGDIMVRPLWQQSLIYVSIGFLYFVLFEILRSLKPQIAKFLWLAPLATAAFAGIAVARASNEVDANQLAQINAIKFVERPNIYFLSFDAMIPESLADKLLSIRTLPYVAILKAHNAQLLSNVFSDAVPTKWSLANILKLIPDNKANYDQIVRGRIPSPLRHILDANGYTTHFTFWNTFFGRSRGEFLDHYHMPRRYNVCSFIDSISHNFGFFGYCGVVKLVSTEERAVSYEDYVLSVLTQVAKNKMAGPQFYMQHFPWPGHTPKLFKGSQAEHVKFREAYLKKSNGAAEIMGKMLDIIRVFDPKALVFIYGDHGAWVSRTLKFNDDSEQFVQDRWGTIGAVINGKQCAPYLDPPAGERFQTTARIVVSLLTCLSGGQSPLTEQVDFGRIRQLKEARFENYIYE